MNTSYRKKWLNYLNYKNYISNHYLKLYTQIFTCLLSVYTIRMQILKGQEFLSLIKQFNPHTWNSASDIVVFTKQRLNK